MCVLIACSNSQKAASMRFVLSKIFWLTRMFFLSDSIISHFEPFKPVFKSQLRWFMFVTRSLKRTKPFYQNKLSLVNY